MKIYIGGLYSGTSPQPGIGLSRSLRTAYPGAYLIGVEYSNRSSGIHWPGFDDIWLQRPWEELDLSTYARSITALLDDGALWIPGTDLEALWLASVFPSGHPSLLSPPHVALNRTSKPEVAAHVGLPVDIPPYISTDEPDWDLHAFCRKHNWRVWLKGPYYEAYRVQSWDSLERVRAGLSRLWHTQRLFIQSHVSGYEESVMLCAYNGELLDAVSMRKRELTEEGKTWAGDVTPLTDDFAAPLREIIRALNWTGGAELEMVRDSQGKRWLLEWNPRFPAWMHGATLAGFNLPALLVESATGIPAEITKVTSEEFTRVVLEIPLRDGYPLPPLPEPYSGSFGHSLKHPSGMPTLAGRLHTLDQEMNQRQSPSLGRPSQKGTSANGRGNLVPTSFLNDLSTQDLNNLDTPSFVFLESTAALLFEKASAFAAAVTTSEQQILNAYSIKTNPDARLLKLALKAGFLAEAISLLEVQKAIEIGWRPENIILNGPGKWWPQGLLPDASLHAIFCDSMADLTRVTTAAEDGRLHAKVFGVRLRLPTSSRFGISIEGPDGLHALVDSIAKFPKDSLFGVHFHMASSSVGVGQWWHLYESMLRWSSSLERLSGRRIDVLDIGGGWFPDDWDSVREPEFMEALKRAKPFLPNVSEVISEPGKAMAQPSMALAMRVLEVQKMTDAPTEAVVDGSIAELPMYFFYPHRILHHNSQTGDLKPIRRGTTRLMGRLCMEHDEVASGVELPEGTRAGDMLIFCDAGGYDRSMSYLFGRG